MPYSYPGNIPRPAKNWTEEEQKKCIGAANGVLRDGGSEQDAILACIRAAGKTVNPGGKEKGSQEDHAEREALRKAAQARAKRYGIGVKDGGNLSPPQGYPAEQGEYGDPVNYRYPCDAAHAKAAVGYFNKPENRAKGGYTSSEWAVIGQRIARLVGRHLKGGPYTYKGGKVVPKSEASWVDLFRATRALAGEPVCVLPLMPDGYERWGQRREPITADVLDQILHNWRRRDQIAGLTLNVPVNAEHIEGAGKIGNITDLTIGDDGLYATLSFTPRGEALLGDDTFDYSSPEIVWHFVDIETGAEIGPALVGLGVTNYPFFGESTAMYSNEAAERIAARFLDEERREAIDDQVLRLGRSLDMAMIEAYNAGVLPYVAPAIAGSYDELGLQPPTFPEEVTMSEQTPPETPGEGELQVPEEFRNQLTEAHTQIERLTTRLAAREAQVDALVQQRTLDQFSREAERYSTLGVETAEYANHMAWLQSVDPEGEHLPWFQATFATADSAMAQSAAFQEAGVGQQPQPREPQRRVEAALHALCKERNMEVPTPGSQGYLELMGEVMRLHPELYTSYRDGVLASD